MIKIYRKHLKPGYCRKGTRAFFDANNLDFADFIKNGIDVEIIEATGDSMAAALAKRVRDEAEQQK